MECSPIKSLLDGLPKCKEFSNMNLKLAGIPDTKQNRTFLKRLVKNNIQLTFDEGLNMYVCDLESVEYFLNNK